LRSRLPPATITPYLRGIVTHAFGFRKRTPRMSYSGKTKASRGPVEFFELEPRTLLSAALGPLITPSSDFTENPSAVLTHMGFQRVPLTITYSDILSASSPTNPNDTASTFSFIITSVPVATGTLRLTHNGVTSPIIVNT